MTLAIIIDRFEGDKAVLKIGGGLTVIWPKKKLPANIKEGSLLHFKITTNPEEEKNKKELAKEILNEILDAKE
jgi:hypothetical protein